MTQRLEELLIEVLTELRGLRADLGGASKRCEPALVSARGLAARNVRKKQTETCVAIEGQRANEVRRGCAQRDCEQTHARQVVSAGDPSRRLRCRIDLLGSCARTKLESKPALGSRNALASRPCGWARSIT